MKFRVLRPHQGDKFYNAGDAREADENTVAHLVKSGTLRKWSDDDQAAAEGKAKEEAEAAEKTAADAKAKEEAEAAEKAAQAVTNKASPKSANKAV